MLIKLSIFIKGKNSSIRYVEHSYKSSGNQDKSASAGRIIVMLYIIMATGIKIIFTIIRFI